MIHRARPVYIVLLAVWLMVVVWQGLEHARFRNNADKALINRAKDISSTVGLVLRSQRFYGIISQERLESALSALITTDELTGVSLLNTRGEVVASAGVPVDLELQGLAATGIHWGLGSVALMNLVDIGTNVTAEAESSRPTLIIPKGEFPSPPTNRLPGPPRDQRSSDNNTYSVLRNPPDRPPGPGEETQPPDRERRRGRGDGHPRFGRPFWMSEEEYQAAIEKKGVHSFVMILSTQPVISAINQDMWLRLIVTTFAGIAMVGFGVAWRNLARTADLEVRLVRASELNTRLKEMNLAAAGLAHETRNPLNIIRGLAQIISRKTDASAEVREKSSSIIDEADRVTAQLNEFINYSRPRDVRRTAVKLAAVAGEVSRALSSDLEDKGMKLEFSPDLPTIEADEQLLRQTLFNLILNAIQAGERGGKIHIAAEQNNVNEIQLDVRDNGSGVPPEQCLEIFRPYVTNHPNGTGLGLAVVQQIVTAHGWEISCLPNEPKGAIFRITHVRLAS
jgi:signal transduction histidine kinase